GALLLIDGTAYDAEGFFCPDGDAGPVWLVVDLRKPDGTHYRLTLGHGDDQCDCPHMTYRSLRCKHLAGVQAALAWLEDAERAEWADALERQPQPASAPF